MPKTVLVTGAGGFIGSHVVDALLKEGARVRALVHYNARNDWGPLNLPAYKKVEVVTGDVRDAHQMASVVKGCHTVLHLAALIPIPYSYRAPMSFVDTNVMGTLHMLEGARRAGVQKFVHISTSEVYGSAQSVPMTEDHPFRAQSPYAATKIGADQIALSYWLSFRLPVTIVRPFNTFGPRQSARAVIPTILTSLLSGQRELRLGDTRPVRDFTYVEDTVQGILAAARDKNHGRMVHLGTGQGWSVADVVRVCAEACGKRHPRVRLDPQRLRPKGSEVNKLISDNGQARALWGWRPRFTLAQGIRRTAAHVRQNLSAYKADLYNV